MKTLRETLEQDFHLTPSSDTGFLVRDGINDMNVSYRYLCCPAWEKLLDRKVKEIYTEDWLFGEITVFELEKEE